MTDRTVLRWEIPVDDQWHTPPFVGSIVHIASRKPDVVEIWTSPDVSVSRTLVMADVLPVAEKVTTLGDRPNTREFRVFGTGQPVEGLYHGTALVGPFAWHLFSRFSAGLPGPDAEEARP